MKNNNIEEKFNTIKKLIEEEKNEALRIFRMSNFNSRLHNLITREFENKSFSIFKLMKSFSSAVLLLFLFTAIILAVFIIPSFFKPKSEGNQMEKFFEQALFFQESRSEKPSILKNDVLEIKSEENIKENMSDSHKDLYISLIELFSNLGTFSERDYSKEKNSINDGYKKDFLPNLIFRILKRVKEG